MLLGGQVCFCGNDVRGVLAPSTDIRFKDDRSVICYIMGKVWNNGLGCDEVACLFRGTTREEMLD